MVFSISFISSCTALYFFSHSDMSERFFFISSFISRTSLTLLSKSSSISLCFFSKSAFIFSLISTVFELMSAEIFLYSESSPALILCSRTESSSALSFFISSTRSLTAFITVFSHSALSVSLTAFLLGCSLLLGFSSPSPSASSRINASSLSGNFSPILLSGSCFGSGFGSGFSTAFGFFLTPLTSSRIALASFSLSPTSIRFLIISSSLKSRAISFLTDSRIILFLFGISNQ